MYGLSARKRPFARGHCGETVLWRILTIIKMSLKNWYVCTHRVCVPDPKIFGYLVGFWWKKNCTKETWRNHEVFDIKWSSKPKKKTEVVLCHLETTISMSKNIFGFATKLRTPLYSTLRSLRLWRGITIVAWVSTSYIAGNSRTNLLAIHIYYHLYPQYIRHHFWRRWCMKRTLVCAFAVTRDKKNYDEKQEYKQHH